MSKMFTDRQLKELAGKFEHIRELALKNSDHIIADVAMKYAAEVNPPSIEPGTPVWFRYPDDDEWSLGIVAIGKEGVFDKWSSNGEPNKWQHIIWKPAYFYDPDQQAEDDVAVLQSAIERLDQFIEDYIVQFIDGSGDSYKAPDSVLSYLGGLKMARETMHRVEVEQITKKEKENE